ncbi:MAG: DUF1653 domain-containing protein [Butyrivibrio sp.]|nr:DUF1653 domain-containing protein [Butyrivibrio sp.]
MSDLRTIMPGDKFRHFKNKLYQIVAVAYHSETREKMVVYQALYGDYSVYVRPYDMFMSEVDREKYPDAAQKYRFEKVEPETAYVEHTKQTVMPKQSEERESGTEAADGEPKEGLDLQEGVNPYLLEFFDRDGCKEKMEYLNSIRSKVDDKLISDIAVSMDFTVGEGTVDERLNSLLYCLQMKARFECGRLR